MNVRAGVCCVVSVGLVHVLELCVLLRVRRKKERDGMPYSYRHLVETVAIDVIYYVFIGVVAYF